MENKLSDEAAAALRRLVASTKIYQYVTREALKKFRLATEKFEAEMSEMSDVDRSLIGELLQEVPDLHWQCSK